jgi:hypothetical protein
MTATLGMLEAKASLFERRFARELPGYGVSVLALWHDLWPTFLMNVTNADGHILTQARWRVGATPSLRAVRWRIAEKEHAWAQDMRAFRTSERAYCDGLRAGREGRS